MLIFFQENFNFIGWSSAIKNVSYFFFYSGKKCSKAPKIQRLVTPLTLQRKRARIADKKKRIAKAKSEAAEYQKLLATRLKEQRERRSESLAKRRSRLSGASKPSVAA
jgi:small subunit ribosomal protein S6e